MPDELRWAVVIADLEPVAGHEQGGIRRCLVVSNEPFHRSGLITICPITAARAATRYPNEVAIPKGVAGQTKDGVILCHRVRTIATDRLVARSGGSQFVGYLQDPALRDQVKAALARHFRLDRPD